MAADPRLEIPTVMPQREAFQPLRVEGFGVGQRRGVLPPPKPVNAAHTRYGHNGRPGLASRAMAPTVGISSTSERSTAQLRPPNLVVAMV